MHDLSWGCPIIVRQALTETLGAKFSNNLFLDPLISMGYPSHFGAPRLIEQLKDMALRQSGHRPKHLVVTCGAIGAINAALHALKTSKSDWVVTNKRYFPMYASIIGLTDMVRVNREDRDDMIQHGFSGSGFISLVDSPSNPEGLIYPFESADIWDSAYASRTYGLGYPAPSGFKVMCGSVSKTLGLSGLRLGWASTDNDGIARSLENWVTAHYIGLSRPSMDAAEEILARLDHNKFETLSSNYLDNNREEMQKLLDRFGQGTVPTRGMFALLQLGKTEKKALEKADVKWLPGSVWGEDDTWARLSLGQTREIIRSAVKAVLK